MSIFDTIQGKLKNKFLLGSLLTTSCVALGLVFAVTQTKADSNHTQSINKDVLIAKSQNKGNAIAYYNNGLDYMNAGQYSKAIDYYSQAIRINPNFAPAYHNRGLTYGMVKRYQNALTDLDIADKLYRQQNNVSEAQKVRKIIALVHQEMNKPNNTDVQRQVERDMRNWCQNLRPSGYFTCN